MAEPTPSGIDVGLLQRQYAELQRKLEASETQNKTSGGGGGSQIPPMSDDGRFGRIEGEVLGIKGEISGIKHAQNFVLGGLGLVAAFVIGFGIYTLQRIDQIGDRTDKLSDRVNELPGKISADLRDLTKTLADSITAAKQAPTQVIMVPTPLPPPTPQPRPQQ